MILGGVVIAVIVVIAVGYAWWANDQVDDSLGHVAWDI